MTRALCICLVLIQLLSMAYLINEVDADDTGPDISNIHHINNYPFYGEDVTVYATITDPDGIQRVDLYYCGNGTCYPPIEMEDPDSDDVFTAIIPWNNDWSNGAIIYYHIEAVDNLSNNTATDYIYTFVASEIDLSSGINETAIRGESVILGGNAVYNANETAPVIFSPVTIRIVGPDSGTSYLNTTTDVNGNFSRDMMFDFGGEYQINITVTNRTLKAYDEKSIMIIDITYLSQKLQMTTCYPNQELWVNGTARYNTQEPVVNSEIEIRVNEILSWTGMTDTSGNYSVLITAPEDIGNYEVNVTVSDGPLVYYNETAITVTQISFPDLSISTDDIVFISTYTPPTVDSEVNITVLVHNSGSADCVNVKISFYLGDPTSGNLIGTHDITQIYAGKTSTVVVKWTAVNGTHDIWIMADPLNTTEESFEDNNMATKAIFVDLDFDGDGIGDIADFDDDNDDSDDEDDEFPYDSSEWMDTDSDGIGNNADLDDDEDGLLDTQEDKNGNGVRDAGETNSLLWDTDNDGKSDSDDYYPLDNKKWEKLEEADPLLFLLILMVLVIVAVVVAVLVVWKSGKKPPEEIPSPSEETEEDVSKPPLKKTSPPPRRPIPTTPKPKIPKETKEKKIQSPPPPS